MKPVVKVILILIGALVLLAGLGVLFMNLYVQSAKTHRRIELKLGEALQLPLKISRATFTPWSGLQVSGITVPQANPPGGGNFLEAPEFLVRLRFWPLFQRKLIIDEIKVTEPKIVWFQNNDGQWKPPSVPVSAQTAPEKEVEPERQPVSAETPQPVEEPSAPAEPEKERTRLRPFEVLVNSLQIDHGSFDFFDRNQKSAASFADVNVRCPGATQNLVEGTARSGKVSIFDTVFVQDLKTSFSFSSSGRLSLPDFNSTIAGGSLCGSFWIETSQKNSPFTGKLEFAGVDLNRLIAEAGGQTGLAAGTIKGQLDLAGLTRDSRSAKGRGAITLTDGQIREYEILQMLGQALQIEELVQLKLQQSQLEFRVDDGRVLVDQLVLQSQNLNLSAKGSVRFDGKMDLHAQLAVNPKISRQLPGFVVSHFKPVENTDLRSLDFDVTGTLSKPRTNIVKQMLGSQIEKQAVDLLQSIFGRKKKSDDKKKPKDQPAAETAPSPPSTPETAPAPPQ